MDGRAFRGNVTRDDCDVAARWRFIPAQRKAISVAERCLFMQWSQFTGSEFPNLVWLFGGDFLRADHTVEHHDFKVAALNGRPFGASAFCHEHAHGKSVS